MKTIPLDQLTNVSGGGILDHSDRVANGFSPVQGGVPGPNKRVPLRDVFDPFRNLSHPGM